MVGHGVDVGTGSQEPLHGGVMACPRRAMQWRRTSGTRKETPLEDVFCFAARQGVGSW